MGRLNIRGCGMISRGWGVCRGGMDERGMVDNWGMVDSMSDWVGNESVVSNWVGNKSVVSNWVSNNSMVSKTMMSNMATMGHNGTMSMTEHMGRYSRGGGGGSKANKSGNNESLHFCSITVKQLIPMYLR